MKSLWGLALTMSLSIGTPSIRLGAWLTYWDLDRGLARLATPPGRSVQDLFLFSAALGPDGRVILLDAEDRIESVVSEIAARGSRAWLTVVNDVHPEEAGASAILKDAAIVHRILSDRALSAAHQREIRDLALRIGVSGIDIDYENLDAADRDRFTAFIASLSSSLHEEGIALSVTSQPKTKESRSAGAGALSWRALCAHVDRLQVMLYNLHSAKTGPGPMATSDWIESVLQFAGSECSPSRVVPALKVSGMEWTTSGTRTLQYDECIELARAANVSVAREGEDQIPHFDYFAAEGPATVYFEDASSIEVKLALVERLGFESVALWSLGREDPDILQRSIPSAPQGER
jgi:spore germination protein YaaH